MAMPRSFVGSERVLSRIPAELRDFANWPHVEESLLKPKERARYVKLTRAIELLLVERPMSDVVAAAGVGARRFYRIIQRCLMQASDGRIWGCRALVSGMRAAPPQRSAPLRQFENPAAGYGGILTKLLNDKPALERELVAELTTARKLTPSPNTYWFRGAHSVFLRVCRAEGLTDDDYPFNTRHHGRRAFTAWMKRYFLPRHAAAWVRAEHGASAAQAIDYQSGNGTATQLAGPYLVWQIDEVTLDVRGRYELPNHSGDWEEYDLARSFAIRVIEIGAGTNLAWRLVLAAQATVNDLLFALWDAISGPPKVGHGVPELDYEDGAGYPANLIPQLRFAVPRFLYLDNALSHLATPLQTALAGVCGAVVRLGRAKTPQERGQVEAKFSAMASRVLHQLPATTGSGPGDPVRKKADVPVSKRLRVNELEQVLDCYTANENLTPSAAAHYVAPLERLRRQVHAGAIRANYLPAAKRRAHYFNSLHKVTLLVNLKAKNARLPHINFLGARYTSDALKRAFSLKGQRMWVRYDPRDLRTLLLFRDDGTEFGPVSAMGRWGRFPHDVRIRKLFLRLKRDGEISPRPEDPPMAALFAHLRGAAPRDSRKAQQLAYLVNYFENFHTGSGGLDIERAACDEWNATERALREFDSVQLIDPAAAKLPLDKRQPASLPTVQQTALPFLRPGNLPRRVARG